MSEGLVEWLRAQILIDEEKAKAAIQGPWRTGAIADHLVDDVIYGTSPYAHGGPGGDKIVQVANLEMAWQKEANAKHIANWDPSRVLREVEALGAIVDLHTETSHRDCRLCGHWEGDYPCTTLRLIAAIYADRPGYQESWRPT